MSEGLMTKWGDICNQCAIWFAQEQIIKHKDEIEAFMTVEVKR